MPSSELTHCLKELRLTTALEHVSIMTERAAQEEWTHDQFLLELFTLEKDNREQNKVARHLRASRLNTSKTFENLEQKRFSKKVNTQIEMLMDGTFLNRQENVLLFGN